MYLLEVTCDWVCGVTIDDSSKVLKNAHMSLELSATHIPQSTVTGEHVHYVVSPTGKALVNDKGGTSEWCKDLGGIDTELACPATAASVYIHCL